MAQRDSSGRFVPGGASADVSSLLAGLKAAEDRTVKAALAAVDKFGLQVLGDAQQLCPVKTGALKASATEEPAELHGSNVTKRIGFNTDYAAAVHERLDLAHTQGQAKFLETAIRNNAPKLAPFVAAAVKKATGG